MPDIKNLYETIGDKAYRLQLPYPKIPEYLQRNLKYELFDWQKLALENFLTYQAIKERENPNVHTHLMFNMATGTGKTLLMASLILYYYKQGYRHFLFFVNRNNIVDKTENNFICSSHAKYLFKEKVVIDDKTVSIKKVEAFSDLPQGIEIKFTSIQKLYNDIHLQRENQTTLDDLHRKDLVMLADEAHHLNAATNRNELEQQELSPQEITGRTSAKEVERKGWEHTVIELILKRNKKTGSNKNVLLEFTATIPETQNAKEKYQDKIIYKFGLKAFLQAGYTKEINLISSSLEKKERILQALLFQWYRHNIAIKNNVPNFKPVVLFRSKTIEESRTDYAEFLEITSNITRKDFIFLKTLSSQIFSNGKQLFSNGKQLTLYESGQSRTVTLLKYIKDNEIKLSDIAEWIKQNYAERNVIITNSQSNTTQTEKTDEEIDNLLNNLEDKNNHIRAIFTVEKLTEGWDVLNLFDIVRLYQGQNAGGRNNTTPKATIKEKQLIGRGVRYYPFDFEDKVRNKRKFDNNLDHELRILEELYYYTYDEDSRYISHLKGELKKDGYIIDDRIVKTFNVKDNEHIRAWKKGTKVFLNKQIDNPIRKKESLEELKTDFSFTYSIRGLEFNEQNIDLNNNYDPKRLDINNRTTKTIQIKFKDIEKHIVDKAINIKAKQENSLLQFVNLKKELEIKTIDELQNEILAGFVINISVSDNIEYDDILNSVKLNIVLVFLDRIFSKLKASIHHHIYQSL